MFNGKVALVTGGSRGIGYEIARQLAAGGADIAIIYAGSEERAKSAAESIALLGHRCEAYKCNVADYDACAATVKEILGEFEKVDILVNNAGVTRDKLLMQMTEQEFDDCISVNLKGAFNLIKHLSRSFLKQRSGRIINLSSVVGLMGNAGQVNYAASKAGVIGLTKSVAKEFGARGITCNAIAPGYIQTDMTSVLTDEIKEGFINAIPLKRAGRPEDVAAAALFLASDAAGYITGQIIKVDGGLYI